MERPCAAHPDRLAIATCAVCQQPVCELCANRRSAEPGAEVRCPVHAELGVPWDQRGELGWLRGYFQTWRGALLDPTRLFRALPGARGLRGPLLYDLITQYVGASVPTVVTALSIESSPVPLPTVLGMTPHRLALLSLWLLPLSGPLAALSDLLLAAVTHLTLGFLGVRGPFARTYAAIVYGSSATLLNVTVILPTFLIPPLWNTYSTIIAICEAHQITGFKAATAYLVPYWIALLVGLSLAAWWISSTVHGLVGGGSTI